MQIETSAVPVSAGQPPSNKTPVALDLSKFRDPSLAMGLALTAVPLELFLAPQITTFFIIKASWPRWRATFRHVRASGKPDVELLDSLWIFFYTLSGEFLAPALSLVLIEAANALRNLTAVREARHVVEVLPSRLYWIERKGRRRRVHLKHLATDDLIHLGRGDQVPADAEILRGECVVDSGLLTGRARPSAKQPGETLYASTLIKQGQVVAKIKRTGEQTTLLSMLQGYTERHEKETRLSNYMEDLGNRAIIPAMVGSAVVFMATGNLNRSLAPLSLDFAQGVGVSAPIPVIRALSHGTNQHGLLVKGGHVLEELAEVDAILFDKTGTLTEQTSVIESLEWFSEAVSPDEGLSFASSAIAATLHPFSVAFEAYGRDRKIALKAAEVLDSSDSGVLARISDQSVMVGTRHYLAFHGVRVDETYHRRHKSVIRDRSVRYVVVNETIVGAIFYTNPIRSDAAETVARLSAMGVACYLCTGDQSQAANAVAYKLGFKPSNTFSDLTAEGKVQLIRRLRKSHRKIAYVGDGWNDVPALNASDLGFSFRDGIDLARESADVVILDNHLLGIPQMIEVSQKAMGLVRQNIGLVIAANAVTLAGGVLFSMGPLASVLINNGSIVVAGVNGLRSLKTDPSVSTAERPLNRDDQGLLGMDWRKRRRKGVEQLFQIPSTDP